MSDGLKGPYFPPERYLSAEGYWLGNDGKTPVNEDGWPIDTPGSTVLGMSPDAALELIQWNNTNVPGGTPAIVLAQQLATVAAAKAGVDLNTVPKVTIKTGDDGNWVYGLEGGDLGSGSGIFKVDPKTGKVTGTAAGLSLVALAVIGALYFATKGGDK